MKTGLHDSVTPSGGNGSHLRQLREAAGLTLAAVAERVGRSVSSLSHIETNRGIPNGEFIRNLAQALSTTPNSLLQWGKGLSPAEVWAFYASLQHYRIEHMTKRVAIDARGDATVYQKIEGLYNETGSILRFQHRMHFGARNLQAMAELKQNAEFRWCGWPTNGAVLKTPELVDDPSALNRAHFEPRFLPSADPYAYEMEYKCLGAFRMTDREAAADPQFVEWSQFFVEKPIRHLSLQVVFPKNYAPRYLRCEIWKGDFLYTMELETVPDVLNFPGHILHNPLEPTSNTIDVSIEYPLFGLSYGIVWRPMNADDFNMVFPQMLAPESVRPQLSHSGT